MYINIHPPVINIILRFIQSMSKVNLNNLHDIKDHPSAFCKCKHANAKLLSCLTNNFSCSYYNFAIFFSKKREGHPQGQWF